MGRPTRAACFAFYAAQAGAFRALRALHPSLNLTLCFTGILTRFVEEIGEMS